MFGTVRTLLRGSLLVAGPAMASVLAFRLTSGLRRPPTPAYDELLVAGAAWALVIGTAWAVAVCAAAVLEVTSTGRWALTGRLGCPTSARRTLLAGLGVLLAGGGALAAAPVSAAPAPLERGASGPRSGFTLPVPARPTGATYSLPRQRVEVQPGDSLWRISQQRAPRASTPDVARLVEHTYRANRRVIGADPDLIRPGQRLVVPRQPHHTPTQPETP